MQSHHHFDESVNFEKGQTQDQEQSFGLMVNRMSGNQQKTEGRVEEMRRESRASETEP